MSRSLMWRGLLIAGLVALALISALPLEDKIRLGLDLRGGTYLVMEVQVEDALNAETARESESLLRELQDRGVSGGAVNRLTPSSFELTGVVASGEEIEAARADKLPEWTAQQQPGRWVFNMTSRNEIEVRNLAVEQAVTTVRNRIDQFGVAEPVIQRVGSGSRIAVQLPGVDDPERIKELIKETAFLEFRLVRFPAAGQFATREQILANFGGTLPPNLEILPSAPAEGLPETYYAVERQPVATGRDLRTATPGLGQFNQPIVNFGLTFEGGRRFGEATGANIGEPLAIVLDSKVVSAPSINGRITDSGLIEGNFTGEEAQDLATKLRSGALPAGMIELFESTVGPSLGLESIRQGFRAGWIGGVLVVLAVLLVYRRTGLNAVLALSINMVLIFGALSYLGFTLTLPGIAGIVLTIGMAVDANVLVFERIREELTAGRTARSAIDSGFSKALSSILDANITTLIAAVFLFQFGTGPVRGFAVTLSIGILASLFTAIFVSRWLFDVWTSRQTDAAKLSI